MCPKIVGSGLYVIFQKLELLIFRQVPQMHIKIYQIFSLELCKKCHFYKCEFEMTDRVQFYTIENGIFTELLAENFMNFDMHMGNQPKNDRFLFLKNCK